MTETRIEHEGLLLGLIIPADYHAEGISFFTDGSSSQQLGYMNRPEGYNIPPHTHNVILAASPLRAISSFWAMAAMGSRCWKIAKSWR